MVFTYNKLYAKCELNSTWRYLIGMTVYVCSAYTVWMHGEVGNARKIFIEPYTRNNHNNDDDDDVDNDDDGDEDEMWGGC